MPDVAIVQNATRDPFLNATLLAHCDRAADIYAAASRLGRKLPDYCAIAPASLSLDDLAFVAWAAALGYREGCEVRS